VEQLLVLVLVEQLLAQQLQVLVQEHFLQLAGAEVLPQQVQVQKVQKEQVQKEQVLQVLQVQVQVGLQQSLP